MEPEGAAHGAIKIITRERLSFGALLYLLLVHDTRVCISIYLVLVCTIMECYMTKIKFSSFAFIFEYEFASLLIPVHTERFASLVCSCVQLALAVADVTVE